MLLFPPAAFSLRGSFCDPCHRTSSSTWAPVMKKMWKEGEAAGAHRSPHSVIPTLLAQSKRLFWRLYRHGCPASLSSSSLLIFIGFTNMFCFFSFLGHRLVMSHTVAVSQASTIVAAGRKEEVWQPLISHPSLKRHLIVAEIS